MELVKTIVESEDKIGIITAFRDKILLSRKPSTGFINKLPGIEKIKRPLYTSYVSERFPHAYGDKGLIFDTKDLPALVLAINSIDLEILYDFIVSAGNMPTADAMRVIMGNFVFGNVDKMIAKGEANDFEKRYIDIRREAIKKVIEKPELEGMQQRKPDLYTEVIFNGPIKIEPKALFGYEEDEIKAISKNVTDGEGFKSDPEWPEIGKCETAVEYFRKKRLRPRL